MYELEHLSKSVIVGGNGVMMLVELAVYSHGDRKNPRCVNTAGIQLL